MHEDLLGYLLGALEPDEMQRIGRWLREDPEAREQLEELERLVRPLEEGYVPVEPPPPDLISRTMAMIPPGPVPDSELETARPSTADREQGAGDDSHAEKPSEVARGLADQGADRSSPQLISMQASVDPSPDGSFGWVDWIGGATAAAVILVLLVQAIAQGRFESRKVVCQDQLRQFGSALTQYVTRSPQERLPAVSSSGPEAFAGVYAMRLNEAGLIEQPSQRWCPSVELPSSEEATLVNLGEIASIKDLHQVSVDHLQQIQRYAGGNYAYNLGVVENERLVSPKFESRSSFAVMSDAPLAGRVDGDLGGDQVGHSGVGINVLYEDGRVRFIPVVALDTMHDHPLVNHRGEVEAGVNIDDASLAPSARPPFIGVPQR